MAHAFSAVARVIEGRKRAGQKHELRARALLEQRLQTAQLAQSYFETAEHVGEGIVDLVGNTGRKGSERGHALGFSALGFDVADVDEGARFLAPRRLGRFGYDFHGPSTKNLARASHTFRYR